VGGLLRWGEQAIVCLMQEAFYWTVRSIYRTIRR
jgi:hypothetical protein